jgi:hypothetical protein
MDPIDWRRTAALNGRDRHHVAVILSGSTRTQRAHVAEPRRWADGFAWISPIVFVRATRRCPVVLVPLRCAACLILGRSLFGFLLRL